MNIFYVLRWSSNMSIKRKNGIKFRGFCVLAVLFLTAMVFASCEGTEKQKEVEKTASNIESIVPDTTVKGLPQQVIDDGREWLEKHVSKTLAGNSAGAAASRTVKRIDAEYSKESEGNAVYLVSGEMQNGTEFSYEFHLVSEGKDFKIVSTDAPKYFYE